MTAGQFDVVAGNVFDKYGSSNPLVRLMVRGFLRTLLRLVESTGVKTIHEIGCGEGYLSVLLARRGLSVRASDVSERVVVQARAEAARRGVAVAFEVASIYDLRAEKDSADLVLCAEVFEHLPDPEAALRVVRALARPYALFSVPREPIWRILNVMRFKYLKDGGNTPGHVQHWSKAQFVRMLEKHMEVIAVASPFPWTMVLCRIGDRSASS
jgi:2-polyprenyl-3-methyl-5-hydroxy-6-metoxy-1,4-benzoquinol methylase